MTIPKQYSWLKAEDGLKMLIEALKHYGVYEIFGSGDSEIILGWAKELGSGKEYKHDETAWCGLPGDTNIITIIRETVTYWNPEKKRYYTDSMQNKKRYLPIPYFERESESFSREPQAIYSDKTYSGLSDDFIIYVYEFKPGKYWEGLKTVDYMPKGWENGFSKGVAFSKSKNVVIYWFVVW